MPEPEQQRIVYRGVAYEETTSDHGTTDCGQQVEIVRFVPRKRRWWQRR